MGGRECCVISCGSSSHSHQGRMFLNGLSFHCFPAWRTKEGDFISELTRRRRDAWVTAVGRREITFDRIPSSMRVCSRHFLSGKPAYEMLDSDPDWVPSLHLGHDGDDEYEEKSWNKRRRLSYDEKPVEGADGAAEARKPPPPAWKDVKSALQSLLEGKTIISQQQGDDEQNQGAETRTDSSFRDFFRNALESSLEASIQARARSKSRPPSTEYEVELNVKLPSSPGEPSALEEPSSSQPSFSPSCANCSMMLQRIRELEQKLFEVTNKHEIKVLNRPKQTITEETRPSGEEAQQPVPSCPAPALSSFLQYRKKKNEERLKQKEKMKVRINIGLMAIHKDCLKPQRGRTISLATHPDVSAAPLLSLAVKQMKDFNKDVNDRPFLLLYPDGTEVINIPGTQTPFTLAAYKAEVGKSYQRISLFLCLRRDFEEVQVLGIRSITTAGGQSQASAGTSSGL
ncbi:uncharacterized protein LOC114156278 isoform X2 [Xiphophorus couchianus]|uniref:uncharacterized protein LOC114156278 isoform X2 n=1 Tax=Xiphophorus couchianus TaxID=32473 RepID=UPI001016EE30|nr:uncharacterized protein LOC114156278 isoform X2 [Xiphophorus couchianus]